MSDKSIKSPFVKFTYTVLGLNGLPEVKSWIINITNIVSIQCSTNKELKIYLSNNQIVNVNLGKDYNSNNVMDEILKLKATGLDYNVYKINNYKH